MYVFPRSLSVLNPSQATGRGSFLHCQLATANAGTGGGARLDARAAARGAVWPLGKTIRNRLSDRSAGVVGDR